MSTADRAPTSPHDPWGGNDWRQNIQNELDTIRAQSHTGFSTQSLSPPINQIGQAPPSFGYSGGMGAPLQMAAPAPHLYRGALSNPNNQRISPLSAQMGNLYNPFFSGPPRVAFAGGPSAINWGSLRGPSGTSAARSSSMLANILADAPMRGGRRRTNTNALQTAPRKKTTKKKPVPPPVAARPQGLLAARPSPGPVRSWAPAGLGPIRGGGHGAYSGTGLSRSSTYFD